MKLPRAAAILVVGLPALCFGVSRIGYGADPFTLSSWSICSVVSMILDAWIIGTRIEYKWPAALGAALAANLIAFWLCCLAAWPMEIPVLFFGTYSAPAPFLNVVASLAAFALITFPVKGTVWLLIDRRNDRPKLLLSRILLAQGVWIPLALGVYLIPDRPYQLTEKYATRNRLFLLRSRLEEKLKAMPPDERLPEAHSLEDLCRRLNLGYGVGDEVLLRRAVYPRFALHDSGTEPLGEWNASLSRLTKRELLKRAPVMLVRGNLGMYNWIGLYVDAEGKVGYAREQMGIDDRQSVPHQP